MMAALMFNPITLSPEIYAELVIFASVPVPLIRR